MPTTCTPGGPWHIRADDPGGECLPQVPMLRFAGKAATPRAPGRASRKWSQAGACAPQAARGFGPDAPRQNPELLPSRSPTTTTSNDESTPTRSTNRAFVEAPIKAVQRRTIQCLFHTRSRRRPAMRRTSSRGRAEGTSCPVIPTNPTRPGCHPQPIERALFDHVLMVCLSRPVDCEDLAFRRESHPPGDDRGPRYSARHPGALFPMMSSDSQPWARPSARSHPFRHLGRPQTREEAAGPAQEGRRADNYNAPAAQALQKRQIHHHPREIPRTRAVFQASSARSEKGPSLRRSGACGRPAFLSVSSPGLNLKAASIVARPRWAAPKRLDSRAPARCTNRPPFSRIPAPRHANSKSVVFRLEKSGPVRRRAPARKLSASRKKLVAV